MNLPAEELARRLEEAGRQLQLLRRAADELARAGDELRCVRQSGQPQEDAHSAVAGDGDAD